MKDEKIKILRNNKIILALLLLLLGIKCINNKSNDLRYKYELSNNIAYVIIIYENLSTCYYDGLSPLYFYRKCLSSFPPDGYGMIYDGYDTLNKGCFFYLDTTKIDKNKLFKYKNKKFGNSAYIIKVKNEKYLVNKNECGYDTFQVFKSSQIFDSICFYYNRLIRNIRKINKFWDPRIGIEIKKKDSTSIYIGINGKGDYCIYDSEDTSFNYKICDKPITGWEKDTLFILFIKRLLKDNKRISF